MTEGTLAADEVRVPLGASPPSPAAPVRASPASPGAPGREEQRGSGSGVLTPESPATECGADLGADEEQPIPYPALAATVFFCLGQTTRPRSWCLRLVCNPYPYRVDEALGTGVWDSPCVRPVNPGFWDPARAGRGVRQCSQRWWGFASGIRVQRHLGTGEYGQKQRGCHGSEGEKR
ncbi:voltage-dependent T-type calcium channel subunit alpha-1H-like [Phodopus roborovskii]|uniref:voltage-dependent T-type calcium channel subunit alpha-1H-like n=1 Tax=Phodopus roborovskii TaxID=109678 RepID=UPI0021E3820B|nr:voltage-dependent T-type calcium channel subunit alpha-1H-like [Phodopus roborovskii]